ncbi:MAG: efflux RND transporter periplasmic adaptor subunit [Halanaerobiales bacterium]
MIKNKHKKSTFVLFIFMITIVVILMSGCSLFPEESVDEAPVLKDPPEPRLSMIEVERGYIAEEITGLSRVAAVNEESLYFANSGRVKEIFVNYGEWVEKDQPLARLEVGDLEYQLELAKLDLRKIELEKERMSFLQGTSVSDYDLQLKEIDYEKVRLRVESLQETLEASTIYAPFDGRVTSLSMHETNMVEEFARVMTVADPSELEVQMTVAQRDINRIVPELRARVQIGEEGQWLEAVVREVPSPSAEIAPGQPDLRVHLDIIDFDKILEESNVSRDQILRFNALLNTSIIIQEKENALILPRSAIREYGERTFVLIKDGEFRKEVDVETGIETRTKVEIVEGLKEGQQVISK